MLSAGHRGRSRSLADSNLEAVEASGFRRCDFGREVATEILIDDAVGSREEGEDMQDEVLFRRRESVPIYSDFFSSPKGGFSLFVHPPDVVVLDGEEDKAMGVCLEERFRSKDAFIFGILVVQDLSI